eukprot:2304088-Prymnesium_polylepis.1
MHPQEVHSVAHVDSVRVLEHQVVNGRLQRVLLEVRIRQVRHRPEATRGWHTFAGREALLVGIELVVLCDALEVEQIVQPIPVYVQGVDLPSTHAAA